MSLSEFDLQLENLKNSEFTIKNSRIHFLSLEKFLKFVVEKMLSVASKKEPYQKLKFLVKLQIINVNGDKQYLELFLKKGVFLGQKCYVIYCYNKSFQQKIDQLNQIMVASISHELRTPLNGMIGTLQSVDLSRVSKEFQKNILQPCFNCSEYLLCLVNDILVFTQISFGKNYKIVYENVNIRESITNVVNLMSFKAKTRNINLQVDIDKNIPLSFCTEPRRLKQVLFNLLGNAIKFTF